LSSPACIVLTSSKGVFLLRVLGVGFDVLLLLFPFGFRPSAMTAVEFFFPCILRGAFPLLLWVSSMISRNLLSVLLGRRFSL